MKPRQNFLDSAHCLNDIFVTRGVTHAEAFRVAEGIATNSRYMPFLQQIEGEVSGVVDGLLPITLAIETAALGEQVEGSLWDIDLQSGNLLGEFDYQVTATLESLTHLFHALLTGDVGELCGFLTDRARTACVLSL